MTTRKMESHKLDTLPTEIISQIIGHLIPSHRANWTSNTHFDPSKDYGYSRKWVTCLCNLSLVNQHLCSLSREQLFKIIIVRDHDSIKEFSEQTNVLAHHHLAKNIRVLVFSYGCMKEQGHDSGATKDEIPRSHSLPGSSKNVVRYLSTLRIILRAVSRHLSGIGVVIWRSKEEFNPVKKFYQDTHSLTDMISICLSEIRFPALRSLATCGPRLVTAADVDRLCALPGGAKWPPSRPLAIESGNSESTSTTTQSPNYDHPRNESFGVFSLNLQGIKHIEYHEDAWTTQRCKGRGSVRHILQSYYPPSVLNNINSILISQRALYSPDNATRKVDLAFLISSSRLTRLSLDCIQIEDNSLSELLLRVPRLQRMTFSYVKIDYALDRWQTVFQNCRELKQLIHLRCNFVSYTQTKTDLVPQNKRYNLISNCRKDIGTLEDLCKEICRRREGKGLRVHIEDRKVVSHPGGWVT